MKLGTIITPREVHPYVSINVRRRHSSPAVTLTIILMVVLSIIIGLIGSFL